MNEILKKRCRAVFFHPPPSKQHRQSKPNSQTVNKKGNGEGFKKNKAVKIPKSAVYLTACGCSIKKIPASGFSTENTPLCERNSKTRPCFSSPLLSQLPQVVLLKAGKTRLPAASQKSKKVSTKRLS
jgi:hypothetical protein